MIDSYFFTPGDKIHFINKMDKIEADFFVIDLEDAVSLENKQNAFDLVSDKEFKENTYIRVPFFEACYSDRQLSFLIKKFDGRIVIPKLNDEIQFHKIIELSKNTILKSIVLIETSLGYINVKEILEKHNKHIISIGFGSHDFCSQLGIKHNLSNLENYKRNLIVLSNAFGVSFIDGVDINLTSFKDFRKECLFAFDIGAKGKFLIHPLQLAEMKTIRYFEKEEVEEMFLVRDKLDTLNMEEVDILKINDKIYEKPHINRINFLTDKIVNKKLKDFYYGS